jgi:hypothetical protein
MQTTSLKLKLLLAGIGLGMVAMGAVFAQADDPRPRSGFTLPAYNVGAGLSAPAGGAVLSGGMAGTHRLLMAGFQTPDRGATVTSNIGIATLAGALTLLLVQRRHGNHNMSRPGS